MRECSNCGVDNSEPVENCRFCRQEMGAVTEAPQHWNGWSSNYVRKHGGYYIHAQTDDGNGRSICGVKIAEGGGLMIPQETEPGCLRCRSILRKKGILL